MAEGTTYGAVDSPGGPSMAAIVGPGDQLRQQNLPLMVRGDKFWGDHRWRDKPYRVHVGAEAGAYAE